MYGNKLCLGLMGGLGLNEAEQIRLFKKTGFEGFFMGWGPGMDLEGIMRTAQEEGMILQSVHAPFTKMAAMWKETDGTQAAIDELLACLADCQKIGAPIMVIHPFIGFTEHTPTEFGLKNYEIVVDAAEKAGVKLAFENVEGEEYLSALMKYFEKREIVGFCWDTGHELCYNRSRDMTASYGDRLLCTHLNDNLGITDPEHIFWTDDLHLLPFDGITDWQSVADRLNRCGFTAPLTFELTTQSKPDRHENDKYEEMPIEEYLKEVLLRAKRLSAMMQ